MTTALPLASDPVSDTSPSVSPAPSGPLDDACLQRVLSAARMGLQEEAPTPLGFVRVCTPSLRQQLEVLVREDPITGVVAGQGAYRSVQALQQAQEVLAVVLSAEGWNAPSKMEVPMMARTVQALWLAARAEGLGMGWLAGFDPARLSRLLGLPYGSQPVALLCLGGLPLGLHALDATAQPAVDGALGAPWQAQPLQWFEDRWGQRPVQPL